MSPTRVSPTFIFVLKVGANAIAVSGIIRFSEPDKHLFYSGKKVQVLFYGLVCFMLVFYTFFS
jgi:hypothetical protein